MQKPNIIVECMEDEKRLTCGSFQVDEGILYVYEKPDNQRIKAVFNSHEWRRVEWL